jgi:hypothetical protein
MNSDAKQSKVRLEVVESGVKSREHAEEPARKLRWRTGVRAGAAGDNPPPGL